MDPILPKDRRPQVRRRDLSGYFTYQCRRCEKWKDPHHYRKSTSSRWGIETVCKVCRCAYENEHHTEKRRQAAKKRYTQYKRRDREAKRVLAGEKTTPTRARHKPYITPTEEIREAARRIVASESYESIQDNIGLDPSGLSRLAKGNTDRVTITTAERMGLHLGRPSLLDAFLPAWNHAGDKGCSVCGTNLRPHQGKGMCRLCYHRDYYGNRTFAGYQPFESWSRYHTSCTSCGTQERRHAGKGLCTRCKYRIETSRRPTANDSWIDHCKKCGQRFLCRNPKTMYCSDRCKQAGSKGRPVFSHDRPCLGCSGVISSGERSNRRYCSKPCGDRSRYLAKRQKASPGSKEKSPDDQPSSEPMSLLASHT